MIIEYSDPSCIGAVWIRRGSVSQQNALASRNSTIGSRFGFCESRPFPWATEEGSMVSMPRQQLNRALVALHRELESGAEIGAEDRDALLQAAREIEEALDRADPEGKPDEGGPLSRRITALIEEFETSHPKFAEILSSVSESLANLGI